jgi:Tfp pilus assembly protein PilZ
VHKGYVTNLSYGGAFLATRESIPVGAQIKLLLSLPWKLGRIFVEAQAKWRRTEDASPAESQSPGVGLEFSHLDEESLGKIRMYLERFQELAARLPSPAGEGLEVS